MVLGLVAVIAHGKYSGISGPYLANFPVIIAFLLQRSRSPSNKVVRKGRGCGRCQGAETL